MALVRKREASRPKKPEASEYEHYEQKAGAADLSRESEAAKRQRLSQSVLSVRFVTNLKDKALHIEDAIYNIPSRLEAAALSKVVSHLLAQKNEDLDESKRIPEKVLSKLSFDFLLENKLIRGSVAQHLEAFRISTEKNLLIEYVDKLQEPSDETASQHPDWVASVDVLGRNTAHMWRRAQKDSEGRSIESMLCITGCYDGVVRVWDVPNTQLRTGDGHESGDSRTTKRDNEVLTSLRCHLSPIKAVSSLYSDRSTHYFATGCLDHSVKVFAMDRNSLQIRQLGVSAKKHHTRGVQCMSAPSPSRVFCTAGTDRLINVFRMPAHVSATASDDTDAIGTDLHADGRSVLTADQIKDVAALEDSSGLLPRKRRKLLLPPSEDVSMKLDDSSIVGSFLDSDDESRAVITGLSDSKVSSARLEKLGTLRGHSDVIGCVDWVNPYALYSGSWDGSMRLWDISKQIDAFTWTTSSAVTSMKFWHQQNLLVSAHSNRKICVWDPRTDSAIVTKSALSTYRSHRLPISGVSCSESSRRPLFATGSHDGKLKFWDLRSSAPLFETRKHNGKILCMDWCVDTVLTGASDRKLHSYNWKVREI